MTKRISFEDPNGIFKDEGISPRVRVGVYECTGSVNAQGQPRQSKCWYSTLYALSNIICGQLTKFPPTTDKSDNNRLSVS